MMSAGIACHFSRSYKIFSLYCNTSQLGQVDILDNSQEDKMKWYICLYIVSISCTNVVLVQLIGLYIHILTASCEVVRGCLSVTFDEYGRARVKTSIYKIRRIHSGVC